MRLKSVAQPEWLTPCDGLRVLMKPAATPVMVEARHLFSELAKKEMDQTGADAVELSRVRYLMSVAMVAAGGSEWDGLEDEQGDVLAKPDVFQVKQLLDAEVGIFEWFDTEYCAPLYLRLVEKKGSGRSPNGTSSSKGQATAAGARANTATPKAPAPTKKTPRKRSKAA